jgi:hypothetical protein
MIVPLPLRRVRRTGEVFAPNAAIPPGGAEATAASVASNVPSSITKMCLISWTFAAEAG